MTTLLPLALAASLATLSPSPVISDRGAIVSGSLLSPFAQTTANQKEPPTPPHTGIRAMLRGLGEDFTHLAAKENAYIALAGGAGALAVHPIDADVNQRLHSHYQAVNAAFAPGKYVGNTAVQIGAALVTYTVGRVDDRPKVSHLGMDLLRAQIVDSALTEGLKIATHRERPDGSNAQSFPSGHASITFATATVIERHLGWRRSALAYLLASYVAASRLHDNRHYLSDVVFGAAVGTISGRTITQHGRDVWTFVPVAVPGGIAITAVHLAR